MISILSSIIICVGHRVSRWLKNLYVMFNLYYVMFTLYLRYVYVNSYVSFLSFLFNRFFFNDRSILGNTKTPETVSSTETIVPNRPHRVVSCDRD